MLLIYTTKIIIDHFFATQDLNFTSWCSCLYSLNIEVMHSPQDLIEDVRFERVVENVYVRIRLDLLQHKKQS